MDEFTVWNQRGRAVGDLIRAALPDVVVVDVESWPRAAPPGRPADVAFVGPLVVDGAVRHADGAWLAGVPWLHLAAAGIDLFADELLRGRELVTCSRGVSSDAIAEFVLAALLAVEKRMPEVWASTYDPAAACLGTLRAATVGVVGFGAIGRRVAELAHAFGADVVACRRGGGTAPDGDDVARIAGFEEVIAMADHLVLAIPLTAETRDLIDRAAFERMRPGVHLVNVARGAIVDHAALYDAVTAGTVAAATLDVTDPEPLPADHPLRTLAAVRISPHVAFQQPEASSALVDVFVANVHRRRLGLEPYHRVDVGRGY